MLLRLKEEVVSNNKNSKNKEKDSFNQSFYLTFK